MTYSKDHLVARAKVWWWQSGRRWAGQVVSFGLAGVPVLLENDQIYVYVIDNNA